MSALEPTSPDVIERGTPLGIRFFDSVTQRFIADGLSVTATTLAPPPLARSARANASGVHVFHDLPGLSRFRFPELGAAGSFSWPRLMLRIAVQDRYGRFQPFWFDAFAPERGYLELDCTASGGSWRGSSPPTPGPAVELFSAPARVLAPTFATLRAELWDPEREAPAAWALLEASVDGNVVGRGLAGPDGRVVVFFAYPEPTELPPGSLSIPIALNPPLLEQRWPLALSAYYGPPAASEPVPDTAALCAALAQPPALLWADAGRTSALGPLELAYGRELVARTGSGPLALSNLWVTPA